jgi:DNA-binding SARP family transcriptional activator
MSELAREACPPAANHLRFSLLGPVRAWSGNHEIALGSPQQRALLAVLLLRIGEPVTNEDAVWALWGDTAPRSADGTVRTYVYRLRRKITEVVGAHRLALRSHSGGYLLTANDATIDTDLFEQTLDDARRAREDGDLDGAVRTFRAALALWRGTPFAGTDTTYFNTERERLEQLRTAAVEELAEAEIDAGEHGSAVTTAKTALVGQPLQERLWELLLRALTGSGRRADALAAYQDARRVLRAELGLEPGPRLQELHGDLLAAAKARPAPGTHADTTRTGSPVPPQMSTAADGFVGRAAELVELTTCLRTPERPGPVGLHGGARLGKTALAVRAALALRPHFPDGQLYVELTGPDGIPVTPEAVLVGLLHRLGMAPAALPRTVPELASLWQLAVGRKQVLVVLDDVQTSGQILPVLPNSPIPSVLLTSRHQLADVPDLRSLSLGGLTLADALQLLGSLVGHCRLHQDVEAAARLVAACAYRPEAVRAAAARLLNHPHRTLQDVERDLRAPDTDNVHHLTACHALLGA